MLYSRDHAGVGAAYENILPKILPFDDMAVLGNVGDKEDYSLYLMILKYLSLSLMGH